MSRFDRPDPPSDGLDMPEPERTCIACGVWVDAHDVAFPLCPSCADDPLVVASATMREGRR